jgi:hypothetical protein
MPALGVDDQRLTVGRQIDRLVPQDRHQGVDPPLGELNARVQAAREIVGDDEKSGHEAPPFQMWHLNAVTRLALNLCQGHYIK